MLSKVKSSTAEVYIRLLTQIIELVMECSNALEIFKERRDVESEIKKTILPAFHKVSVSLEEYFRNALGNPFGLGWRNLLWTQSDAVSEIKVNLLSTFNQ